MGGVPVPVQALTYHGPFGRVSPAATCKPYQFHERLAALLVALVAETLVAVIFRQVVQAHPLAQPMACLEPGLIQPVDPGLIQPVVVHEPVAVLWFPSSKHSPGSRWTFWEGDLLEPGGRCEPVPFLQAGLIQPGLIQPVAFLQAGTCWKRQKCYS